MNTKLSLYTVVIQDHDEVTERTIRAETSIEAILRAEHAFYADNPYGYTNTTFNIKSEA